VTRLAVVCGAGGLIGGHLVTQLVEDGYRVRGVDLHYPWGEPPADDLVVADLRDHAACERAVGGADEVYQLAADMGGMEFITTSAADIMFNNAMINLNMVDAAARAEVGRYFLSSSVCVYRDMAIGEAEIDEDAAYPAQPDNDYGWEKLYAERAVYAYAQRFGFQARVARFENCYGPRGAWRGGREKAPAALCRKVAQAPDGGAVEVFGGGRTVRSFVYVEDLVRAVRCLVDSDETRPTNIGVDDDVTIAELVALVAEVAGKRLTITDAPGPLGVTSRNFSHERIRSLGWAPQHTMRSGIERTYAWVKAQVEAHQGG
jgi:nucleoside-diphosphate-sugar epimerase